MGLSSTLPRLAAVAGAILAALVLVAPAAGPVACGDGPEVHAVVFYRPHCGSCYVFMTEDLPPLLERYGEALQVAAVDIDQDAGRALYLAAVEHYGLQGGPGVPTLLVGEVAMVGSRDIRERLPGLVDQYLAAGGVDWPDVPGLAEALATGPPPTEVPGGPAATGGPADPTDPAAPATSGPSATPAAVVPVAPGEEPPAATGDLAARLGRDPVANALAIVVLAAMLAALAWAALAALRAGGDLAARPPAGLVAALALAGIVVAAYLAYVETAAVEAVCGPVGDCNAVQQSEQARLLGVLPVGVAGLAGYAAILGAWVLARRSASAAARPARLALVAMAFGGTLFSAWLTFLEPFVIGAVCAWCLSSAIVMTLLLVVAVRSMAAPRAVAGPPPPAPTAP